MNMSKICFLLSLLVCFCFQNVSAQSSKHDNQTKRFELVQKRKKFYVGNGLDFAMLSTTTFSKPGVTEKLTNPRLTAVVNLGFTFNFDLEKKLGIYTGIGIRNLGFVEKIKDSTIKRRVYALSIPIGIKIGDIRNRNFLFVGGGVDIPFNYREKGFVKRSSKQKFNEWFSERTTTVLPYVFIGYSFDPGITLKFQYYPGNFMNTSYTESHFLTSPGYKTYAGYNVHFYVISLGFDIHYAQYKIEERAYKKSKKASLNEKSL